MCLHFTQILSSGSKRSCWQLSHREKGPTWRVTHLCPPSRTIEKHLLKSGMRQPQSLGFKAFLLFHYSAFASFFFSLPASCGTSATCSRQSLDPPQSALSHSPMVCRSCWTTRRWPACSETLWWAGYQDCRWHPPLLWRHGDWAIGLLDFGFSAAPEAGLYHIDSIFPQCFDVWKATAFGNITPTKLAAFVSGQAPQEALWCVLTRGFMMLL